jgi:acetyl-CoA carboxylase beta subunit
MSWVSFITGGMTVIMAYAVFSAGADDEEEMVGADPDLVINEGSSRHVTLSCQTCRKLKRHREVKPDIFQCTKCKRHVDISA